jgi:hypothetical protein
MTSSVFVCEAVAALVSHRPISFPDHDESTTISPELAKLMVDTFDKRSGGFTIPINVEHKDKLAVGVVVSMRYVDKSPYIGINNTGGDEDDFTKQLENNVVGYVLVKYLVTNQNFINAYKRKAESRLTSLDVFKPYTSSDGFVRLDIPRQVNTDADDNAAPPTTKDVTGEDELLSSLTGVSLTNMKDDKSDVAAMAMCLAGKRAGTVTVSAKYHRELPAEYAHHRCPVNLSTDEYLGILSNIGNYKASHVSKISDDLKMYSLSRKRLHYALAKSDEDGNVAVSSISPPPTVATSTPSTPSAKNMDGSMLSVNNDQVKDLIRNLVQEVHSGDNKAAAAAVAGRDNYTFANDQAENQLLLQQRRHGNRKNMSCPSCHYHYSGANACCGGSHQQQQDHFSQDSNDIGACCCRGRGSTRYQQQRDHYHKDDSGSRSGGKTGTISAAEIKTAVFDALKQQQQTEQQQKSVDKMDTSTPVVPDLDMIKKAVSDVIAANKVAVTNADDKAATKLSKKEKKAAKKQKTAVKSSSMSKSSSKRKHGDKKRKSSDSSDSSDSDSTDSDSSSGSSDEESDGGDKHGKKGKKVYNLKKKEFKAYQNYLKMNRNKNPKLADGDSAPTAPDDNMKNKKIKTKDVPTAAIDADVEMKNDTLSAPVDNNIVLSEKMDLIINSLKRTVTPSPVAPAAPQPKTADKTTSDKSIINSAKSTASDDSTMDNKSSTSDTPESPAGKKEDNSMETDEAADDTTDSTSPARVSTRSSKKKQAHYSMGDKELLSKEDIGKMSRSTLRGMNSFPLF